MFHVSSSAAHRLLERAITQRIARLIESPDVDDWRGEVEELSDLAVKVRRARERAG